ncbi:caspase domain-containing protein [Infundibulicybe gibba]|nr:caspase domain-containing protein [Infundibulicybe gibba]
MDINPRNAINPRNVTAVGHGLPPPQIQSTPMLPTRMLPNFPSQSITRDLRQLFTASPRLTLTIIPDPLLARSTIAILRHIRTMSRHKHTTIPNLPPLLTQYIIVIPNPRRIIIPGLRRPLDPHIKFKRLRHLIPCTGRKKALCIGINYRGQANELRGCINDAKHVREFLIKHHGYKDRDIMLLTDESSRSSRLPTRENIIAAMRWLVQSASTNDSLFFHYSGHGGQTPDLDGDEVDGQDEVIFPLDFKQRGHIVDDEMHRIMVRPLPAGCRLTALFDSCHSGTVLDLPYIYSSHGRLKGSHIKSSARTRKSTPADVISWSGCKDGQTSADTFAGGVAVGAMSYAFITSLSKRPALLSFQSIFPNSTLPSDTASPVVSRITKVHQVDSTPQIQPETQLGSSHHINTGLRFIL